jgi:hypothetical protein
MVRRRGQNTPFFGFRLDERILFCDSSERVRTELQAKWRIGGVRQLNYRLSEFCWIDRLLMSMSAGRFPDYAHRAV